MKKRLNILDENQSAVKVIFLLAWPAILEQILLTAVNYVDTAMVGAIGTNATASVGLVMSTIWLVNGFFAGISVGLSVPVGRAIGEGDLGKAKRVVKQSFLAVAILGVSFAAAVASLSPFIPSWLNGDAELIRGATTYLAIIAAGYPFTLGMAVFSAILRCQGDTKTPLVFNIFTNLINVILNFLFIYPTREIAVFGKVFIMWGAGWGIAGAASTTVAATAFSCVMLGLALMRKKDLGFTFKEKFHIEKDIWKEMLVLGSPVALERVTLNLGQVVITRLISGVGKISLAAHTLALTAESITYMPGMGFSVAATTLSSQSLGAKKEKLAKKYTKYCVIGGMILMSLMGVVLYLFSYQLISVFTADETVRQLGSKLLKIESFPQALFALSMVASGALRGAGDTKWPFFIALAGMWLVRIPLAFILFKVTGLGVECAWYAMATDLAVRGIISFFRLRYGNWTNAYKKIKPQTPLKE